MPLTFYALPPEILLQIFLSLTSSPSSLLAVQLTCSYLHTLISGSSELRYEAALISTQQVDNPYVGAGGKKTAMTVKDKLEWMQEATRRWSTLDLDEGSEGEEDHPEDSEEKGKGKPNLKNNRRRQIKVNHVPSGIYDLTGGVYLLGDLPRKCLYWVKLPGREEIVEGKENKWNKIDLDLLRQRPDSDGRERTIIDMGMCVYEHDLVAIVTLSPQPTQDHNPPPINDIDLVFLQFSTGLPHPALAIPQDGGASGHTQNQNYIRRVASSPVEWHRPAVSIEIVGDHLVLVLYYHVGSVEDKVYVWEWKTGVLKMSLTAPRQTYSGLLFLTPSLILLPNTQTNTLDIFHIPSKPIYTPAEPILILHLPALAGGRTLAGISCRAEPNPVGSPPSASSSPSSSAAGPASPGPKTADSNPDFNINAEAGAGIQEPIDVTPTRPFLPSAEHAICIFSLRVLGGGFPLLNLHFGHTFTFVVHRNALIKIVERAVPGFDTEEGAKEQGHEEARGNTPEQDQGAERDRTDDEPAIPGSFPSSSYVQYSATKRRSAIPYVLWGPPITRWFNSDSIPTRWITTTCGQRLVLTADNGNADGDGDGDRGTGGFPYVVLDFCQENVRRMGARIKGEWDEIRRRREAEEERRMRRMRGVDKGKRRADDVEKEKKEKREQEEERGRRLDELMREAEVFERVRMGEDDPRSGGDRFFWGAVGSPAPVGDLSSEEAGAGVAPAASGYQHHAGAAPLSARSSPNPLYVDLLEAQGGPDAASASDDDDDEADEDDEWAEFDDYDDTDDDDYPDPRGVPPSARGRWSARARVRVRASAALHGLNLPDDAEDDDEDTDGRDQDGRGVRLYTTNTVAQTRTRSAPGGYIMDIDDDGVNMDMDMDVDVDDDDDDDVDTGPEDPNLDADADADDTSTESDVITAPVPLPSRSRSLPSPSLPLHRLWHVTTCEPLEPVDAFAERVEGRLPYVACASERRYRFEGVLVDEERVVGISTDMFDRVKQIDVHYFG